MKFFVARSEDLLPSLPTWMASLITMSRNSSTSVGRLFGFTGLSKVPSPTAFTEAGLLFIAASLAM